MTTPSEPTTPTPEQRAATINDMCPEGWSVRPSGSSLAIVNPGAPDAPPAVIHADDAAIVATIWRWASQALQDMLAGATREAVRCGEEVVELRGDVERLRSRLAASEAIVAKLPPPSEHATELAPFAAMSLADIGHAAWLCGYHPGDDPRKVFERAARRASEWLEIEALLADDLKKTREEDPACTMESLVESIRDDAHAFAGQIGKMHAELERLGEAAGKHALACLGWSGEGDPIVWAHAQREKHAEPTLARLVQLEADVATLVTENNRLVKLQAEHHQDLQGLRDEAAVWRERFEKHEADIRQIAAAYFDAGLGGTPATPGKVAERLKELGQVRRAMATLEARHAAAAAERDEFWTALRAIGLRDAESLEDFQARIISEGQEAMWWRDNRADLEALRELQKARNDLRVYETDVRTIDELASVAARLFDRVPESLEARSYDADRGASIAVRITRDPKRVRVETAPINVDLRSADPEKLAAVLSTPIEPRLLNKPVAKPGRNVMDEVLGLGEQTKRFDRAAMEIRPYPMAVGATNFAGGETLKISVDGPVPTRAAGWTGITWMSGKGRAKSLTLPGLRVRADLGPDALRSAKMESLSRKAIKVLQRRDRLYAFHLPGGVKRYGYVDTWGYLRAGEPLAISIRPPKVKAEAPKPVRQGIAWRRPGHDVDSFAEVPIRPTYDEGGNQVIEVHAELPEDLQHEIKQTSRNRPTITVTTANGATLKGPIAAWMRQNGPDGVLWRLTMPQRVPLPT